jgi:hypothetical protein
MGKQQKSTFCVHYFRKAYNASEKDKILKFLRPDNSYKPSIGFNALKGEIIPDLYSNEYEFDANEYQKWHLEYKFTLDAAANITNHKCENFASKDKSFLDLSAKDLYNKSILMFPPIELVNDCI